jgi:bifunctional pyridoxal-dependent enzyme with beta-cystathionase and maltose regulon repressor activities
VSLFDIDLEDISKRRGRKWTKYDQNVIPMWIADSDFHIAPKIKDAIINAVHEEDIGYGDDSEVRKMMSEKIEKRNGFIADAENIYITQGVLPSMWLACRYACDPGDEVVVTDPMYYPFFEAIEATGAKPVYWGLNENEKYWFNVDRLNEIISEKTRLIFLCNPHNPTGRAMTKSELSGLADLVVDHDLTVMADELWEDVLYDCRQHISLASLGPEIADRTLTAFGFSKIYSVAGLQIGYLASTNKKMMVRIKEIANCVLRGTSTLSLAASRTMLSEDLRPYLKDALAHLQKMRNLTTQMLNEIDGVACNSVEATYLAFPKVEKPSLTNENIADYLLKNAKVAVEDGLRFGPSGKAHFRINFGTGQAVLLEAVRRIGEAFDKI